MIKYQSIHTFTGADIAASMQDTGLTDVTFTCFTYRPTGWSKKIQELAKLRIEGINNPDLAYEIISQILIKIEQDNETYLMGDIDKCKELRDSVERQAPGHGDEFICNLALALYDYQYDLEQRRLGNLKEPLPVSENGNGKKREKSAVKA